MKEMKRITFKIDERLSDAFDQEAVRQHRSRSNLLEAMIIRFLAEQLYIEKLTEEVQDASRMEQEEK